MGSRLILNSNYSLDLDSSTGDISLDSDSRFGGSTTAKTATVCGNETELALDCPRAAQQTIM